MKIYCKKEFLTDSPEPSTSTIVCFHGKTTWHEDVGPEELNFIEISSCHDRARLHRTCDMTHKDWIKQVKRLKDNIEEYLKFLKTKRK